ncbi:MAG: biotin--[acetyl-CoA-carboxylase] ligase [Pseudobdellovibrionaceae bacterium]|jgi:BirA family biotin operon repressor/biotin-[acetyl-CoA-carboxylase] ligase|nr:biotin--[acetyl-CoA-carboxylase] ligase [Pseudobdellovibrionaceae bacterium]
MNTDWTIHFYPEVSSTQDVAKKMIEDGTTDYFVVQAAHQTKGRGRSGRQWSSLEGNLQATICIPMNFDVAHAANYSFLMSVAVSSALEEFLGNQVASSHKIQHKWPNDVWVDGRKICGILLEIHEPYLVIGCGINLQSCLDENICLAQLTSGELDVRSFLELVLSKIDLYRGVLSGKGFAAILDLWLAKARGIGEEITVRTETDSFVGIFEGLEPTGALRVWVRDEGRESPRIIHSADVFFSQNVN